MKTLSLFIIFIISVTSSNTYAENINLKHSQLYCQTECDETKVYCGTFANLTKEWTHVLFDFNITKKLYELGEVSVFWQQRSSPLMLNKFKYITTPSKIILFDTDQSEDNLQDLNQELEIDRETLEVFEDNKLSYECSISNVKKLEIEKFFYKLFESLYEKNQI